VLIPLLEVWPGGTLPAGGVAGGTRLAVALAALASEAPVEDILLVGRLEDVPTSHLVRPDGPTAPAAGFGRPQIEDVARDHGALP
jgi:hypothetical protein